jgi:hypothetical protein
MSLRSTRSLKVAVSVIFVVGSILLAIFLYLIALISVPVIVFFPAYSIHFFAARYPALSTVPYPPVAAPATPQILPLPPPPEAIG